MQTKLLDSESLTRRLQDRQVSHAAFNGSRQLRIQFSDGTALVLEACPDGLALRVNRARMSATPDSSPEPTKRQLEYLAFIARYIQRYGMAPAAADIALHFMVSAPSVNQMMQTLEQRAFIARQPGVPRSTRICIDLNAREPPGAAR